MSDKPITKEELGSVLHKYLNPLYEDVKSIKKDIAGLNTKIDTVEKGLNNRIDAVEKGLNNRIDAVEKGLNNRIDTVEKNFNNRMNTLERIQLRMENKLVDDNKLLHDRDDAHDKKFKDHEKRIKTIENSVF